MKTERDHSDRDGSEPGNALLPLHPKRVPTDCGRAGHQQALRKHREIDRSRRRRRAIPGINCISPTEHSGPCEHNHRNQVNAPEALLAGRGSGCSGRGGELIQPYERAGTCQQVKPTESHAMNQCPEGARCDFHLPSLFPRISRGSGRKLQFIEIPFRSSAEIPMRSSAPATGGRPNPVSSCLFPMSSTCRRMHTARFGRLWNGRSKIKTAPPGDS
jgi:hypothetical protein